MARNDHILRETFYDGSRGIGNFMWWEVRWFFFFFPLFSSISWFLSRISNTLPISLSTQECNYSQYSNSFWNNFPMNIKKISRLILNKKKKKCQIDRKKKFNSLKIHIRRIQKLINSHFLKVAYVIQRTLYRLTNRLISKLR